MYVFTIHYLTVCNYTLSDRGCKEVLSGFWKNYFPIDTWTRHEQNGWLSGNRAPLSLWSIPQTIRKRKESSVFRSTEPTNPRLITILSTNHPKDDDEDVYEFRFRQGEPLFFRVPRST